VNPEWSDGPSLFGEKGSYLNFTHPGPGAAWFASKLGAQKVGVVAYSVSQSAQCAQGAINTWEQYGQDIVLKDTSLPFGFTDISGDITQLKNSGAQFVGTCMDPTGNVVLSKGLQEAGLYNQVKQYWPNGYDQDVLSQYAPLMEGVYFSTGFVPYTYGFTQGMDNYLSAMKRIGAPVSDVTLAGWINARPLRHRPPPAGHQRHPAERDQHHQQDDPLHRGRDIARYRLDQAAHRPWTLQLRRLPPGPAWAVRVGLRERQEPLRLLPVAQRDQFESRAFPRRPQHVLQLDPSHTEHQQPNLTHSRLPTQLGAPGPTSAVRTHAW
jgi:hypothetical protein